MDRGGWEAYRGKRVLLLQGPIGPFFRHVAKQLTHAGAVVHKVNFNGGDWLFYPTGSMCYTGRMEDLEAFLDEVYERLCIDVVMLFGDCRPIHRVAHALASRRGLEIGVFEEGYVRPNYITFERFGVNGYSRLPRDPAFYAALDDSEPIKSPKIANPIWHAALWGILYYLASVAARPIFRHYRHHRPLRLREAFPWVRSFFRKFWYRYRERGVLELLTGPMAKKYYLVPLQVSIDAQVHVHSPFGSVETFLRTVVESFALHAPKERSLVIKHHPLDRGHHDYGGFLKSLADEYGVRDRLLYIHDQHLPTLINHSCGVVVLNSTVGLQALHHNAAVKACGKAVYDMPGLTFQGALDSFWRAADDFKPDRKLFVRFRNYLISTTQIHGSFYRPSTAWWSLDRPAATRESPGTPLPLDAQVDFAEKRASA